MAETTTAWLVDRIRAGDTSAWEDLIELYEGRLAGFIRARLRDPHLVEDVVQETLLGFLRSIPHFDA
ncbi:MAG: RNA polymerase sigma factor, partial [Planctomycetia bacterium]